MAVNILDVACDAATNIVTVQAVTSLGRTKVAGVVQSLSQEAVDAFVDDVRNSQLTPGGNMYFDGSGLADLPARPTEVHTWSWDTLSWVAVLDDLRALKVSELKQARDATEYGQFTYDGFVLDGDAAAQRRLAGLVSAAKTAIAAGQTFTTTFILADNTTTEFTAEDFIGIEMAKIWQVGEAFTRYRELKASAEAATTVEELDAISWD